jgi:hypothetical protein
MAYRRKRSVSFDPELDTRIEAAAAAVGMTVSAWLARCAEDRLITEDGLRAMDEYETLFGALPSAVLEAADAEIDTALASAQDAYRARSQGAA